MTEGRRRRAIAAENRRLCSLRPLVEVGWGNIEPRRFTRSHPEQAPADIPVQALKPFSARKKSAT